MIELCPNPRTCPSDVVNCINTSPAWVASEAATLGWQAADGNAAPISSTRVPASAAVRCRNSSTGRWCSTNDGSVSTNALSVCSSCAAGSRSLTSESSSARLSSAVRTSSGTIAFVSVVAAACSLSLAAARDSRPPSCCAMSPSATTGPAPHSAYAVLQLHDIRSPDGPPPVATPRTASTGPHPRPDGVESASLAVASGKSLRAGLKRRDPGYSTGKDSFAGRWERLPPHGEARTSWIGGFCRKCGR